MTATHLNHNAREQTPATSAKRTLRKARPFSNLACGACKAANTTPILLNNLAQNLNTKSMSRYQPRSSSPGSRKLIIPGRSSTGTFSSPYEPHSNYSRSPRDDYASPRSGGVVPISTEVFANYPPSTASSAYSGRRRRSTLTGLDTSAPPSRTRAVIHDGIARPSSPLSRTYEPAYIKPATTRHEHKKMYSVDNGSAKLIAETEVSREPRRDRSDYHLTGGSNRGPREVDESSFSYTTPAGMYADTEPRWRSRRGSVDRDTRRPASLIDPYLLPSRPAREAGPPPSTRGFDKIVDLSRGSGSLRDPLRSSSRDRQRTSTYDPYRDGSPYDKSIRPATTMPVIVNQPPRDNRDDRYYQDEYDDRDYRRSRRFEDDAVAARGFGIRSGSVDRHGSLSSSAEVLAARPPPPPPAAIYTTEPLIKMPSKSEYMPSPVTDEPRRSRADPRDYVPPPPQGFDERRDRVITADFAPPPPLDERRDRGEPRLEPRNLPTRNADYLPPPVQDERRDSVDRRERERVKEREYEKPRERQRERDRDYERPKERDFDEKPRKEHDGRDLAAKGMAAAGLAAAGAMAGAAVQDRRNREVKNDSDEERRRSRREPNDREDDRERKYAERDREDRKKDKRGKEEPIDPDEDYRRRVQQAELELTRQRSNEDDRSGSDRERRRRDRREREERERDRPKEIREAVPLPPKESRRPEREPEIVAPPKETNRRDREDSELLAQASQQHNQYDSRHNSVILDRAMVPEPESMGRDIPAAAAGAAAVAGSMVLAKNGPRSETATERERRVTIVEPRKDDPSPEPTVKSILRKPTTKFPEDPHPIREGVTPLKERLDKKGDSAKEIPKDAKWTKIDRKLVNPQSLEEKGERFEERLDCVIVLRVLTKDEISKFAKRTEEIREEREERYRKDKHRHRRHQDEDDDDRDPSSDSEEEYRRRKERERGGDRDRERERERERERGGERDRERDSHRRRDYDDDYSTEEESARRAIEEGKRKKSSGRGDRVEDDSFMSGGIGR